VFRARNNHSGRESYVFVENPSLNSALTSSGPNRAMGHEVRSPLDLRAVICTSACLLAAFLWLYQPTLSWLVGVWRTDEYYSHGPLLPLISLYLIWQQRAALRATWDTAPAVRRGPLLLLLSGLGVQFLATLVDVNFLKALSIPVVLLGMVYFVAGAAFARPLRFPLLYLALGVPLSGLMLQRLCVPMQNNAASWAGLGLGLLGIPLQRDGVNIHTSHYHFVVDVPCSGLNTAITLVTIAVLIVHLLPNLSNLQRCLLCLLSVPIALLANTLRIITIVVIGHSVGIAAAEGFLHNFSGVFMFGISLGMLIGLGHLLKGSAASLPVATQGAAT